MVLGLVPIGAVAVGDAEEPFAVLYAYSAPEVAAPVAAGTVDEGGAPCCSPNCAETFYSRYFPRGYDSGLVHGAIAIVNSPAELRETALPPEAEELYCEVFFDTHYLALVTAVAPNTGRRHRVDSVAENGDIFISVFASIGGQMMTAWSIVVELCRGFQPEAFHAIFSELQPRPRFTLTLHGNGGTPEIQTWELAFGWMLYPLPASVERDGYEFAGWVHVDGRPLCRWDILRTDTALYAQWEPPEHLPIAAGTVGEGGAPWRLYECGTVVVEPGSMNWYATESPWNYYRNQIQKIIFTGPIVGGRALANLFNSLSNVSIIEGLDYFDTGDVIWMNAMFFGASGLTSLDLSDWDTSSVGDMAGMFFNASGLTSLDLSGWNISNVGWMGEMFSGTSSLMSLDLSGWDTDRVADMTNMFLDANSLCQLTLGERFRFMVDANLPPVPQNATYTGRWQLVGGNVALTSAELMANQGGAGTWVWQTVAMQTFPVVFNGNGGYPAVQTIQVSVGTSPDEWIALAEEPVKDGYEFVEWVPTIAPIIPHTFIARWEPLAVQTVTVSFHGGGGYPTLRLIEVPVNADITEFKENAVALAQEPIRDGYKFVSWTISPADVFPPIFIAQWEPIASGTHPFTDVPASYWAYGYIQQAHAGGFVRGNPDGTFNPYGRFTRAEAATVLWRVVGSPMPEGAVQFFDVAPGTWYANPVAWAAEQGVILGRGNGLFAPGEFITRQEFFVLLERLARWKGVDTAAMQGEPRTFADHDLISPWARDAALWVVAAGIVHGNPDGRINPHGTTIRAEAAALVVRFAERVQAPSVSLCFALEMRIREDWALRYPTLVSENVIIDHYFGTYNGKVVLMIRDDENGISAVVWEQEVVGFVFHYNCGRQIYVWYDGDFFSLPQALEQGLIRAGDVRNIHYRHQQAFPFMYLT